MSITQLRPHLYLLPLGRYQAYLWRDADSATLVDTGERGSAQAIAAGLAELGMALTDVDQVFLTHFHDDHTGGAAEVRAASGAQVIAHRADAPVIQGERPGPAPNLTEAERELHAQVAQGLQPAPPVPVDRPVVDGDHLEIGGGAVVVGTPGHTDGSAGLYLPAHGVLFTGDVAAQWQGEVMFGVFHLDREQAAASLARLADLDPAVACFGHGEPVTEAAAARLHAAAATAA